MEPANGYILLLLISPLLQGVAAVGEQLQPPGGPVTFSALPLNPRSISVHWTTVEFDNAPITGYRVVTTPQTTQGGVEHEAIILGAEVSNHTFTGLSPYEYDQSQDGVLYETTVQSMNANGLGPAVGSAETIIPPCHGLCNFRFFMGAQGCTSCVCNPAYTGEQCDEPTFYPGNVQAAEVLVDGSYVLQISWDPPPFETLDGRLIGGYGVTLLQGQAVIGTGSTDDNVTSVNLTISGLERSTNYTIFVETRSDIGDTAPSPPVLTTTLPNPPTTVNDLCATVTSSTSIQLSWNPPSATNGPITGYRIMYVDGGKVFEIYLNETSTVIEGLTSSTTYEMRVSAENAGGFGASVMIAITTSADSPCPSLSDPLNGTVTLTGNTTDDAATYSCNDGYSLVGGSSRVCQANGTWSGNEPVCQLCPMDHYVSAADLTCVACPDNSGSFEGTANITGCVCYRGYTGNNGGPCNPCPMGAFKPLVGDGLCVDCPTLLTTSGTGAIECDTCRYSSGDPIAGQECYAFNTIIQFSDDTATDTRIRLFWTPISTVFSISGDEVGMVVAYRIWCSATGGSIPGGYTHLLSVDIPTSISTVLFGGLQPLVEYTFNITIIARINNVEQPGPPGPPLMITTLPSPIQPVVSSSISTPSLQPSATVQSIEQPNATPTPTTAAVLLAAPETVTAVVLSGTEVTVTWSEVDGASGYEILVTSTHGSDTITVIGGLVLTKAIMNLIPYTNYTIKVAGVPGEGNTGIPSEPVYVTTNEEPPSPPTNVHVFEEDGSLINVTWSPPEFPNGVITGYKVTITLESGAIMTYTVDPQLSVILPKPSGAYSVSIIAINGIGASEAEEATIVEQPTDETGATTSSSTDLNTAIVAGIVVGGLLFILLLSCLCCVIACCLYYKRKKMGDASFARENSYVYAQGDPATSGHVPLDHPENQLTAKRWMRMNMNYSSASALLPPMSVNLVETNIDAVDGMYAEVNEMQRMRDGKLGEPPNYLDVVRDAQPSDYGNEELYLSMEKIYFVDVDKTNSLAPYELDDSRLEILEDQPLGEGEFGRVVKGVAKGVVPGQPKSAVAIKMLKEGASDSTRKDFLGEAHMLAQFQHQNVMTLLGVVTNKKPSLVITHFMPNGSLKTFLKGQKKKLAKMSSESPRNFRVPDQLEIAEQIASGMEYLASKFFIHRDLAARNVLVGEKNHVKISDFGLSRALARDDTYYYLRESKKLPVKWMALESIEYRKFSTYSDIWSFGVVVWEIFSYGAGPYKGIAPTDVINHLRAGNRLECPEECPQEVYDMMKLCWEEKKEQRPTFFQMKMRLKVIGIASRRKESKNETEPSKDNAEDEIYINDDMGP